MLLICWFFNFKVLLDPKFQTNRLQIAVVLLILSRVCFKYLSINSAFSCWFVDFVNDRVCQTQKFRGSGCRSLLICWCVEVLNCWLAGLLTCWAVDLLSCWTVELLSCWFVNCVNNTLYKTQKFRSTGCRSLLICWFLNMELFYT